MSDAKSESDSPQDDDRILRKPSVTGIVIPRFRTRVMTALRLREPPSTESGKITHSDAPYKCSDCGTWSQYVTGVRDSTAHFVGRWVTIPRLLPTTRTLCYDCWRVSAHSHPYNPPADPREWFDE